jgi:nitrogenase iron protein NifH
MRKIAIYGKGGIGKSTIASGLSAALALSGHRVMQIGCDPKADSTKTLTAGKQIRTVLNALQEKGGALALEDVVTEGFAGVLCAEAGGPEPGVGCAGRGIITAFETLEELRAFEVFRPDVVLYDVLGDVVCGGFTMPIRSGYAEEILIVTSGEMMSLYAADAINRAVRHLADRGYARVRGVILNARDVANELGKVQAACGEMQAALLARLPRNAEIQTAEECGRTVLEALPDGEMAHHFFHLAKLVAAPDSHNGNFK